MIEPMINLLLFLGSCVIVAGGAQIFCRLGQSALTTWITLLSILANLFVLKQIDVLGSNATASDVFVIGSLLGLNLLQEKYGSKATQQAIWISFCSMIFFVIMSKIHLLYIPSDYDHAQKAYEHILMPAPRLLLASLLTFFIVQQFDNHGYKFLRKYAPNLPILWASALTMCVSQFLDTVLFSIMGLYGLCIFAWA